MEEHVLCWHYQSVHACSIKVISIGKPRKPQSASSVRMPLYRLWPYLFAIISLSEAA